MTPEYLLSSDAVKTAKRQWQYFWSRWDENGLLSERVLSMRSTTFHYASRRFNVF